MIRNYSADHPHMTPPPHFDPAAWQSGLIMLRYDEAVFVTADEAGVQNLL